MRTELCGIHAFQFLTIAMIADSTPGYHRWFVWLMIAMAFLEFCRGASLAKTK